MLRSQFKSRPPFQIRYAFSGLVRGFQLIKNCFGNYFRGRAKAVKVMYLFDGGVKE